MKGLVYFWDTVKYLSPGVLFEHDKPWQFADSVHQAMDLAAKHESDVPMPHRCAAALCFIHFPGASLENAPGDGGIGGAVSRMQNPGYGPIDPRIQMEHFGIMLVDVGRNITLVWNGLGFSDPKRCNVHQVRQVHLSELGQAP